MHRLRSSLAGVLLLAGTQTPAATPENLTRLYAAVPPPPTALDTALGWVENGRIVASELVAVETLVDAQLGDSSVAPAVTAGDPTAPDGAAVLACVSSYRAYLAANTPVGGPLQALQGRLVSLGQGYAGLKQRTQIPELLLDIHQRELASHAALFADWKSKRQMVVEKAQRELEAAGDPASIRSPEHRSAVQAYRAAMLLEIRALAAVTRQAVEAAAGIGGTTAPPGAGPSTLWDLMSTKPKQ